MRNDRQILWLVLFALVILILINLSGRLSANYYKDEFEQLFDRLSENHIKEIKERFVQPVLTNATVVEPHLPNEHAIVEHNHLDGLGQSVTLANRTVYPRRQNMGDCPKIFGKVLILVAYVKSSMETHYKMAQETLQCYLKGTNYEIVMVDVNNDPKVKAGCPKNVQLFFMKHCAAAQYINTTDWMLVLDADAGIANPNHCIEEWIDDRVDIIFYERFFNWEIASGNYLVKNTPFAKDFLTKWGEFEFTQPQNFNGADNGVLQILILQTVLPDAKQEIENCDAIWHNGTDYNTYMNYVTCCKLALGATRLWPGKIRIYRRAHGWVRDGFTTNDMFCDRDFMLHGWKKQQVGLEGWQSPFNKNLDPNLCGKGWQGWDYREGRNSTTCEAIRTQLANFETGAGRSYPAVARTIPYLSMPDVGKCFPHCDDLT